MLKLPEMDLSGRSALIKLQYALGMLSTSQLDRPLMNLAHQKARHSWSISPSKHEGSVFRKKKKMSMTIANSVEGKKHDPFHPCQLSFGTKRAQTCTHALKPKIQIRKKRMDW